ncbi:hypothetical protein LINGRAHAP2_LOCUS4059 [Linum grandiflorum]
MENESINTWEWFVDLLKVDLEIPNTPGWTFMSNRQKVNELPFCLYAQT